MFSRWRERLGHALGFRLALWYAAVFVTSSLTLVLLTYFLLAVSLRQYDREMIQSTLVRFAASYARGGVDALAREFEANQVAAAPGPIFVRTLGRRQDLIFVSMPEAWQRFDLSQLQTPALTGEQTWATLRTGDSDDAAVLEVASVRLPDGTLFQVGQSTERRSELLRRFRRVLFLDIASIIVIGLAGGALLTSSALRPVRTLTGTLRRIMRTGRTDTRVPVLDSGDAFDDLSALVNAMLDRIDAVVAGMRGALDNVAHDLRTPMARLRSRAETALSSRDPNVLREALADCLEESDRVVDMLRTLMDISEAETGTMALQSDGLNLRELIAQTIELYEDVAEERGVRLSMTDGPDVEVVADRNRIRQVLGNLVDNAIKYSAVGGEVSVAAVREGPDAVLRVTDKGQGIPADELPHIWERLYRGDKSRAERGLGLGLALVKAIVEAHGGTVSARSGPGEGAEFTVRLPASPQPRQLAT